MQKAFDQRVKEILAPMAEDGQRSREYVLLLQHLETVKRKLVTAEEHYQHAFQLVTQLEQNVSDCRTEWQ